MAQNFTDINGIVRKLNRQSSVGYLNKEVGPINKQQEVTEIQEKVEHEPSAEVADYVKVHQETIQLPPDLKKIGIQSSAPTSKFSGYQNIKLPISDDKIVAGMHQPVNTSIRWLSTLATYFLKRVHLSLKVIGGKVVRVFKA